VLLVVVVVVVEVLWQDNVHFQISIAPSRVDFCASFSI